MRRGTHNMSDLSSAFLSALMGGASGANVEDVLNFRQQVQENNILNDLAPAVLGAKFRTDTWSPTETLGVTAGQAFLGTLLSGLARRDAAEQFSDVASVLPQLYEDPLSVGVPEGVDPEAFGALKLATIARGARQKADTKNNIIKELLGLQLEGQKEKLRTMGKIEGETLAYGSGGNPNDPRAKLARELEDTTYSRIAQLPQYKLFADVASNFKGLEELAKQGTRAADIGMLSTIARIRDPNSVVREGEVAMNADTQAYLDKMLGDWRSVVSGASRLKDTDKAKIIASVVPKYNELGKSYLESRNPLLESLSRQGGNPANIPTMDFSPFDMSNLLTESTASDLNAFIGLAKDIGLTKEQARARWNQLKPAEKAAIAESRGASGSF